jgi:hypothetical protein
MVLLAIRTHCRERFPPHVTGCLPLLRGYYLGDLLYGAAVAKAVVRVGHGGFKMTAERTAR